MVQTEKCGQIASGRYKCLSVALQVWLPRYPDGLRASNLSPDGSDVSGDVYPGAGYGSHLCQDLASQVPGTDHHVQPACSDSEERRPVQAAVQSR